MAGLRVGFKRTTFKFLNRELSDTIRQPEIHSKRHVMDFHKILESFGSGLFLALGILAILLAAIFVTRWLLLPFAVFGIRSRLDRLLTQTAEIRSHLQHVANVLDPDGMKARLHEQYADSLGERRTAKCPHCNQQLTLKNLPAGSQHECPHCKKAVEILS